MARLAGALISAALIIGSPCQIRAQEYQYRVDLTDLDRDRICVELGCPVKDQSRVLFHFPRMEPGHYRYFTDYGRFVEDFEAFDSNGRKLEVERSDINTFRILNATDLQTVRYFVNDTWDAEFEGRFATCVGTNFDADQNFVINPGGVFGFFDGMKDLPLDIEFTKPSDLLGLTSLATTASSDRIQCFKARSYGELFDSPFLFARPDTASFTFEDTTFRLGVYSELGHPLASEFAEIIKPKIAALRSFTGQPLPVDHYLFLFYIKDFTELEEFLINCSSFRIGNSRKAVRIHDRYMGYNESALEHVHSSLYCLAGERSDQTVFGMLETVIHEFFHIYTPKSLCSDLMRNFDYMHPQLSRHRWLYEGVTEYFAGLIKLRSGLWDINRFLQQFIRQKIQMNHNYPNGISITELSRNANRERYRNHYGQFYATGPLVAMLLDFEILRLTRGERDLRDVFFSLYQQYGGKVLEEDEIIPAFIHEVHPDLQRFFDRYVEGVEPIDLENGFKTVGILFQPEVQQEVPITQIKSMVPLYDYYWITKVGEGSVFQKGDKIHRDLLGRDYRQLFRQADGAFVSEGETVSVHVVRNGEVITLDVPARYQPGVYRDRITVLRNMSLEQERLYRKWTGN